VKGRKDFFKSQISGSTVKNQSIRLDLTHERESN
jgi:hypothetical protein